MLNNKLIRLYTVVELLVDHGILHGDGVIEPITPSHGPCCTCQSCGFDFDSCVCDHNSLLKDLLELEGE